MFLNIYQSGVGTVLFACYTAGLVPCETAAVSAYVLCTPYNHTPVYSVTLFKGMCRVHVCLSVTCTFWQNDKDVLQW